jgi:hypothetical protein
MVVLCGGVSQSIKQAESKVFQKSRLVKDGLDELVLDVVMFNISGDEEL